MKKDLRYEKNIYQNWKLKVLKSGEPDISKENSKLFLEYILDMEIGMNISRKNQKKGGRSEGRLNYIRRKLKQVMQYFEKLGINPITNITEKQAIEWNNALNRGMIKRIDGKEYGAPSEFIVTFKAFWNWYIKSRRKLGVEVKDLTEDLDLKKKENTFVYLSKDQVFNDIAPALNKINPGYGILVRFLFDSITRFPTEASSLQEEFIGEKEGEVWISIPKEISKTFGRDFNLLYCGEALLQYLKEKKKEKNKKDDKRVKDRTDGYVFSFLKNQNGVYKFNTILKETVIKLYCEKKTKKYSELSDDERNENGYILFVKGEMLRTTRRKFSDLDNVIVDVYKDKMSDPIAKKNYSEITGYDFRHDGAVHLRELAHKNGRISLDAIRARGAWADFDMLNYYTKFLKITGKISKEETLVEEDRTKMKKEMETLKKNEEIVRKKNIELEKKLKAMESRSASNFDDMNSRVEDRFKEIEKRLFEQNALTQEGKTITTLVDEKGNVHGVYDKDGKLKKYVPYQPKK